MFSGTVQRLLARGVGRTAAEDAAQEAGTRALTAHISFTDADDLIRWISTVAWRIAVDEHRRHSRRVVSTPVADRPSNDDVATAAEARVDLRLVTLAWPRLSATDRAALLAPHPETGDRRAAVRTAVRRHRARNRLVALIEALGALALIPLSRLRRTAAAIAAVGVVPLTAAVLVHIGGADLEAPERASDDAATPRTVITTTAAAVDAVRRAEPHVPEPAPAGAPTGVAPTAPAPEQLLPPVVDAGVEADLRPRDDRDDSVICVRLPAEPGGGGERCVESIGDDLELSHLDDPLG